MAQIAKCESGFNQKAYNPKDPHGGSYGLFQINGAWLSTAKGMNLDVVHNIADNFEFAGYILKHGGINSWSCNKRV